jgi:hypothetical protein
LDDSPNKFNTLTVFFCLVLPSKSIIGLQNIRLINAAIFVIGTIRGGRVLWFFKTARLLDSAMLQNLKQGMFFIAWVQTSPPNNKQEA